MQSVAAFSKLSMSDIAQVSIEKALDRVKCPSTNAVDEAHVAAAAEMIRHVGSG